MFKLFQSLFDRPASSPYPESIIGLAIERAVDATDPRLRSLPGWRDRLRPAVLQAIDQVVALVGGLPPGVELSVAAYSRDPQLAAFFASPEHLRQVLAEDTALRDFLDSPAALGAERVHALLLVEPRERNTLGMELHGDVVQREVAQVTVGFSGHRLLDPAADAAQNLTHLRRRAFDHLLQLALGRITALRETRGDLRRQRELLQRKLDALEAGGWGFDPDAGEGVGSAALEQELAGIEARLRAIGGDEHTLAAHMEELEQTLAQAPQGLYADRLGLILDPMGVKRDRVEGNARELNLYQVHSARGMQAAALPVYLPRAEFPQPRDMLAEAARLLG